METLTSIQACSKLTSVQATLTLTWTYLPDGRGNRTLWGLFEIMSVGSVNDSDILWFSIFSKHDFEVPSFHCLATTQNLDNYWHWKHMETLTSIQACSKLTSVKETFTLTWAKLTQPRTQHSTAEQNTAEHNRAQHSTTALSTAKHNPAQHTTAQQNKAQHRPAQHNTAQHYWLSVVTWGYLWLAVWAAVTCGCLWLSVDSCG